MNEKGISFAETLLTVLIIFTLAGTIIPFSYKMNKSLEKAKVQLHAAEVAYNAAKIILFEGSTSGSSLIEDIIYQWDYDGHTLCVKYEFYHEEEKTCINQESVV